MKKYYMCKYNQHTWVYDVSMPIKSGTYIVTGGKRACYGCNSHQSLVIFKDFTFPLLARLIRLIRPKWMDKLSLSWRYGWEDNRL